MDIMLPKTHKQKQTNKQTKAIIGIILYLEYA
jgi:hypothetical protein